MTRWPFGRPPGDEAGLSVGLVPDLRPAVVQIASEKVGLRPPAARVEQALLTLREPASWGEEPRSVFRRLFGSRGDQDDC